MDIKKMLKPIISAATGLLGLIFLAINYMTVSATVWGQSFSRGLDNGYGFCFFDPLYENMDASFFGYITSGALLVVFLASIALLLVAAAKILRDMKILQLPENVCLCKVDRLVSRVFQIAVAVAFVCTLIFGFANSQDGLSLVPGAGAWLLLVLAVVSALAPKFIAKMNVSVPAEEAAKEEEKTEE